MMSNWLSEDCLLYVKEEMTLMGAIGLEPVSAIFQPKSAINEKPPKISMHIKDVSPSDSCPVSIVGVSAAIHLHPSSRTALNRILYLTVTLRDVRKNGQWSIKIPLDDLEKTVAKIFIRIKDFHSLHISAADIDGDNYPRNTGCKAQFRSLSFDCILPSLSAGLIRAASSFPPQSISVQRLLFPPHPAAVMIWIPMDAAFKLITYLTPSLLQLRFCYSRPTERDQSAFQWERLFSLLAEKCPGLQKLKLGGHCDDWPQLQAGLNALTNLCSFHFLAFDANVIPFRLRANWLHDCFHQNDSLKHLSVGFNALSSLAETSTSAIVNRLETLTIDFAFAVAGGDYWSSKDIRDWIAQALRNPGQSVLRRLLAAMPDNGRLSMRLNCLTGGIQSSAISLIKVVFKVADKMNKRISARFIRSVDMMQIAEKLKNEYPLLEIDQNHQDSIIIRHGTATCVFTD